MRFSFYFGLVTALLSAGTFAPQPAYAAPVEQISCAHEQLSAEQRRQMLEIVTLVMKGRLVPKLIGDESEKWMDTAISNCAARHGWNEHERENAKQYTAFIFFRDGLKADPALAGADFAALDRYAAQLRPHGDDNELTSEENRRIVEQLARSGIKEDDKAATVRGVLYLRVAFSLSSVKAAFAASKRAPPFVSDIHD